tara:strand:- start:225 stop:554 length:330 start_codon:yes stop_codon:yes gene_type:complete
MNVSRMNPPVAVCSLCYVLELQDGCYYVGQSYDINFRISQHKSSNGSRWTKLHKPIRIHSVRDDIDENTLTKEYMRKYGWEKVRGGSWCKVEMKFAPNLEEKKDAVCLL